MTILVCVVGFLVAVPWQAQPAGTGPGTTSLTNVQPVFQVHRPARRFASHLSLSAFDNSVAWDLLLINEAREGEEEDPGDSKDSHCASLFLPGIVAAELRALPDRAMHLPGAATGTRNLRPLRC